MKKIPQSLQGILWSKNVRKLCLNADKPYIVHQILRYGQLKDIRWLLKTYGINAVKREFKEKPQRIYTKPGFHFIKEFVLKLRDPYVKEERYIEAPPRFYD